LIRFSLTIKDFIFLKGHVTFKVRTLFTMHAFNKEREVGGGVGDGEGRGEEGDIREKRGEGDRGRGGKGIGEG
jgi:hypothetical protein